MPSLSRVVERKLADVASVSTIIKFSFKLRVPMASAGECGSLNFILHSRGTATFLACSSCKKGLRRVGAKENVGLVSVSVPFLFRVAGAPCLFCFGLPLPLGLGEKFRGLIMTGFPSLYFLKNHFWNWTRNTGSYWGGQGGGGGIQGRQGEEQQTCMYSKSLSVKKMSLLVGARLYGTMILMDWRAFRPFTPVSEARKK